MAASLDGVWAKLDRARYHLDALQSHISDILAPTQEAAAAGYEYDPERQQLIARLPAPKPADPSLPLIVGDCIHNTRSALDHLVYQLAILNNAPASAAEKTAFPVYLDAKKFRSNVARKVAPFISDAALTAIEELQPYAAGNDGDADVLWILSQLDIIDKHRLLLVAVPKFQPSSYKITVSGETFEESVPFGKWKTSIDGAEIIRFDLSDLIKEPGKVNVKIQTASAVMLENSGTFCDGLPIQFVLTKCIQHAINIVGAFSDKFFGS